MMAWGSVPICDDCWRQQEGDREPVRFRKPDQEQCYACGKVTLSGIYVRRIHGIMTEEANNK
jgi:hypothetical protein